MESPERQARLEIIKIVDEALSEYDHDLRDQVMIRLGTAGLLALRIESKVKTMLTVETPAGTPIEVKRWQTRQPSDVAIELAKSLRDEHANCRPHHCSFVDLFSEDVQEILDRAPVLASRSELEDMGQRVRDEILRRRLMDLDED